MKKILFILAIMIASMPTVFAQMPGGEMSAAFEEPEGLDTKVVQCDNGNTFLFTFTKKDGIEVTVYDPARKQLAHRNISGKSWDNHDMKRSKIDGIYNISGSLVMFLEQFDDRTPKLFRIIFNTANGEVTQETQIAEMQRYGSGAGYAMLFGNVEAKAFHVEKDPNSDAYAVVLFDGFSPETAKRIEVVHYSGQHKEINRAYYDSPENRYKYINYIGMVVDGEKQLFLCTYAFNTESAGGAASRVIISRLAADSKEMEHHAEPGTENWKKTKAILTYNRGSNVLELLTISYLNSSGGGWGKMFSTPGASTHVTKYKLSFATIDPTTLTTLFVKPMAAQKLNEYQLKNGRKHFSGLPMNLVINADNTTTIVFEEMVDITSSNGFTPGHTSHTTTSYYLEDMGILDLDEHGQELNGYALQKEQKTNMETPALAQNDLRKNIVQFERQPGGMANLGFYSFDYLSNKSGRYVIFNDRPDNFDRDEKKEPKEVMGISECNTICYKLNNGQKEKFYLFGAPGKDFDNRFALISSGDYNEQQQTYAVMLIERAGRKKQARLAWVKFE